MSILFELIAVCDYDRCNAQERYTVSASEMAYSMGGSGVLGGGEYPDTFGRQLVREDELQLPFGWIWHHGIRCPKHANKP